MNLTRPTLSQEVLSRGRGGGVLLLLVKRYSKKKRTKSHHNHHHTAIMTYSTDTTNYGEDDNVRYVDWLENNQFAAAVMAAESIIS
jgi:hypothetical protein